jgi:hypothetical protein
MWLSWNIWEDIFHWGKNILESNNEFCKEFSAYYEINDKSKWIQASFFGGQMNMLNILIDKFNEFMINDTKYIHYRHLPIAAEESYLTKIINDNNKTNEYNILCKYYAINFFEEFKKYLNIENIYEYEQKFPDVFIVQKYAGHLKQKRHSAAITQTEEDLKKFLDNCFPNIPKNRYSFDKIYCFNLYTSKNRYQFMKDQFDKINLDVEFVRAYPINIPNKFFSEIAFDNLPIPGNHLLYTADMYNTIKKSLDNNYEHILIFEDNVKIDIVNFINMINHIPNDYDILRIVYLDELNDKKIIDDENTQIINDYFCINNKISFWGTQVFSLSRKGMEYFINYIDNKLCQADLPVYDMGQIHDNKLINYYCYNKVGEHNKEFKTTMKTQ